jgi:hypothetical protein
MSGENEFLSRLGMQIEEAFHRPVELIQRMIGGRYYLRGRRQLRGRTIKDFFGLRFRLSLRLLLLLYSLFGLKSLLTFFLGLFRRGVQLFVNLI